MAIGRTGADVGWTPESSPADATQRRGIVSMCRADATAASASVMLARDFGSLAPHPWPNGEQGRALPLPHLLTYKESRPNRFVLVLRTPRRLLDVVEAWRWPRADARHAVVYPAPLDNASIWRSDAICSCIAGIS